MDLSMELGNIEVIAGLVVLLFVAPLLQFWTLKLGLNGMREHVKEIRADLKILLKSEAAHEQRLLSLESRMTKVET